MQSEKNLMGHILFSQSKNENTGERFLIFIEEYADLADAEERKAKLNREMPAHLRDTTVSVGSVEVFFCNYDEENDYAIVTPRDGSEPFNYQSMIHINDILKLSEVANGGKG